MSALQLVAITREKTVRFKGARMRIIKDSCVVDAHEQDACSVDMIDVHGSEVAERLSLDGKGWNADYITPVPSADEMRGTGSDRTRE